MPQISKNWSLFFRSAVRLTVCLSLLATAPLVAGEPAAGTIDSSGILARLSIEQPSKLWDHPVVRQVWQELQASSEVADRLAAPELDYVRQLARLLEDAAELDLGQALSRLTAGGVDVLVTRDQPPRLLASMTADDPQLLAAVVSGIRNRIRERLPEAVRDAVFQSVDYDGATAWRVGQAWYAVVDRSFLLSSDEGLLKSSIGRLQEGQPAIPGGEKSVGGHSAAQRPAAGFSVDLSVLRGLPGVQKALEMPAADGGAVAFVGGWLDLLRRSDRLSAEARLTESGIELALRLPADRRNVTPGLDGFFAAGEGQQAAPLLTPPEMIYSASWFRDYYSLWENRTKLVTAEAVKKMEEGDEAIRQQISVFKIDFTPSEMFRHVGAQFRVVAVRQESTPYRVELNDRLPAGALVVSLRDEQKFSTQLVPVLRVIGLITGIEQGITTRRSEHSGAELTGFWFRDDPEAVATTNRALYNLSPTFSITRGHFILGSTRRVVEQVIDELDRQAAAPVAESRSVTESSRLSFAELSRAVSGIRESAVRSLAVDQGLTVEEAEREIDVFVGALGALGEVQTEGAWADEGFEYRVRIGTAGK